MKKILLLIILIMIPSISICQSISLNLSSTALTKEQSVEVYKGLKQGESLKFYSSSLRTLNKELESIVQRDSVAKINLKTEIDRLNDIILSKDKLAKKSEEEKKLEIEKAVKKNDKHWGIGPVIGYGLSVQKEPSFQPFIGVGIYYSIFKF